MKLALITGITGQDGSYLAEFLLRKGYEVHGMKRRSSSLNTSRIDHIFEDPHESSSKFFLHYGDLTDSTSLTKIIGQVKPDEIYNLGAQSHVGLSFECPEYTSDVNAIGTLRLLEAIRLLGLQKKSKFYQASTSELYGLVQQVPQNEGTMFYPRSPYAVSKLFAYWTCINYREAYGIYACNGILFNHESPRRGETFVTRKITRSLANITQDLQECLYLGNLDAQRDWGHARDYVEMQWLMLQQAEPKDYVIASGIQHSVREFVVLAAKFLGMGISFDGSGTFEIGRVVSLSDELMETNKALLDKIIIRIDPRYFRPTEVNSLLGDATRARNELGWAPKVSLEEMVQNMIDHDLLIASQNALLKREGLLHKPTK
jgi:GDPmannose 4,6-dehydratase